MKTEDATAPTPENRARILAEGDKRIRKNERMFRWNPFGFMVRAAHDNLVYQNGRLRKIMIELGELDAEET